MKNFKRNLILSVLVLTGLIINACGVTETSAKIKCLNNDGIILSEEELIDIAIRDTRDRFSPDVQLNKTKSKIFSKVPSEEGYRVGEYSEYYAKQNEKAHAANLSGWSIVAISYKKMTITSRITKIGMTIVASQSNNTGR